jgi:ABC-type dipeptide/oligopeptide/nickel transport system ATPase component
MKIKDDIMKKIVALQGSSNCGKSTTIRNVFELLVKKYNIQPSQIQDCYPNHGKHPDCKVILKNVNGHKIGIEGQGDPNSRQKQSFDDFAKDGCDIIFCTCRTSGMTVDWINAYKDTYELKFIQQTKVPKNKIAMNNDAMAKKMIEEAGL